jgi:hypothetical protein
LPFDTHHTPTHLNSPLSRRDYFDGPRDEQWEKKHVLDDSVTAPLWASRQQGQIYLEIDSKIVLPWEGDKAHSYIFCEVEASRVPILKKKIQMVKFKECIVIICKFMNRNKIFGSRRNMKDISKNKISITGMNCRLTNMANRHT